jgi:hypothetical protein
LHHQTGPTSALLLYYISTFTTKNLFCTTIKPVQHQKS